MSSSGREEGGRSYWGERRRTSGGREEVVDECGDKALITSAEEGDSGSREMPPS
jgi:hypothetical protein